MARSKVIYDKKQIVEVAFQVVTTEGKNALSIRRVAKELNVSSMTMYNYIENVDEIKKEVIVEGFNQMYRYIYTALNKCPKAVGQQGKRMFCETVAGAMYDFSIENKGVFELMLCMDEPKFRRDAELRPFYGYLSRLSHWTKLSREEQKNYHRILDILQKVIQELLFENMNGLCSYSRKEYDDYIHFVVSALIGGEGGERT